MPIFGGASRGAVIALRCPHCGIPQARARAKAGTSYSCKACGKSFTREEGLAKEAEATTAKKRRPK